MATKFETKWAITQLVKQISKRSLCLVKGFHSWAIEWCRTNSTTTNPHCNGNEICDKNGYHSACI